MQPGEGKDYVSKTCAAVRMLLEVCSARQRASNSGSQATHAQAPLTPDPSELRATGPSTSTSDDPDVVDHGDMAYLATGGFDNSMVTSIFTCNVF